MERVRPGMGSRPSKPVDEGSTPSGRARLNSMAPSPSGKAEDCKSSNRRFDSGRGLQVSRRFRHGILGNRLIGRALGSGPRRGGSSPSSPANGPVVERQHTWFSATRPGFESRRGRQISSRIRPSGPTSPSPVAEVASPAEDMDLVQVPSSV